MRKMFVLGVVCVSLSGCGFLFDPNTILCGGVDPPSDVDAIPSDLRYVIDNRGVFEVAGHPLDGVVAGTVIDDLEESLAGCWGWVDTEMMSDTTTGRFGSRFVEREVVMAGVCKVDLEQGLLQMQEFAGLDGGLGMWDDLPAVFIYDRRITGMTDRELSLETLYNDGALVENDGTLRGDCLTAVAATITTAVPIVLSVDGDAMVTFEDFEVSDSRTRLWTRFDCVEPEIALLPQSEPDDG